MTGLFSKRGKAKVKVFQPRGSLRPLSATPSVKQFWVHEIEIAISASSCRNPRQIESRQNLTILTDGSAT